MANVDGLSVEINNKPEPTFKQMVESPVVKKRFEEVLKDKAPQCLANLVQLANSDLQGVEPNSIFSGALISASLDLPLNKSLGWAYLVPFKQKTGRKDKTGNYIWVKKAQFQIGWKGFYQLAMRTGQYKHINAIEIYEGELIKFDRLTEKYELGERTSNKVVGYMGYFELVNGFTKITYWTEEEMEEHATTYSQTYSKYKSGLWKDKRLLMAKKTVLKNMLSKWGILSIELQKAIQTDQTVITKDITDSTEINEEDLNYIDNGGEVYGENAQIEVDFKEVE